MFETQSAPPLFLLPAATIRNDSARTFDDTCSTWSVHQEFNYRFLKAQQSWANDMLRSRGHVLLNDVYDALGLQRTKLGAVAGWTTGDTIDFGVVSHDNNTFDLNFNIRGVILDDI